MADSSGRGRAKKAAGAAGPPRTMRVERIGEGRALLTLTVGSDETRYVCREIGTDVGGRAFRLHRVTVEKGADEPSDYDVLLGGQGEAQCECKGFLRWDHCKHVDALRLVCERGLGGFSQGYPADGANEAETGCAEAV